MGVTSSCFISAKLFAITCEWQWHSLCRWVRVSGVNSSVPGAVSLKRVLALAVAATTIQATAMGKEPQSDGGYDLAFADTELGASAKVDDATDSTKAVDFVLAEVRKRLDPNPETEILELKIDPDYRGAKETYLVNAVLDAHGRKLTLGIMVSLKQMPRGLQVTMGYVD